MLDAADVHVARRLARLAGEDDEAVLLAVALAVRGAAARATCTSTSSGSATPRRSTPRSRSTWPRWRGPSPGLGRARSAPARWSATGDRPVAGEVRPLRLVGSWLYLDRYWAEEVGVARSLRAMAADPGRASTTELLADGLARLFGAEAPGARHRRRRAR